MDVSTLEIPLYNIMIYTDTNNDLNVYSTMKKETKSPALLKLLIYSTELAAVIFLKAPH